jgi:hypothetical protein
LSNLPRRHADDFRTRGHIAGDDSAGPNPNIVTDPDSGTHQGLLADEAAGIVAVVVVGDITERTNHAITSSFREMAIQLEIG